MAGIARRSDPELWDSVKSEITAGDKPGPWSARKAQRASAEDRRRGGGHPGRKAADTHLTAWRREGRDTRSGAESLTTGERTLPRAAREQLSEAEYDRSTAARRRDLRRGRQVSAQPPDVAAGAAAARKGAITNGKGEGTAWQRRRTMRRRPSATW